MKTRVWTGIAVLAALALSGCMRMVASYTIDGGSVDAVIVIRMQEDYINEEQPYRGTPAGAIADHFTTESIVQSDDGEWKGYQITLTNEPLSHFTDPPEDYWDIQIVKEGTHYVVHGLEWTEDNSATQEAIATNDGYLYLNVEFDGNLVDWNPEASADQMTKIVQWELATATEQPYARAQAPAAAAPDPEPEPEPVVTVVVTPSPSAEPEPSASPSAGPVALPEAGDDSSVPVWVWIVGGALLVAVAGMGAFLLAKRSKTPAVAAGGPAPAMDDSTPPTKETPVVKPAKKSAGPSDDTQVIDAAE